MINTYEISYFNQLGEFVISTIEIETTLTVFEANMLKGFENCSVLTVEPVIK